MKVKVYKPMAKTKESSATLELLLEIFEVKENPILMSQAVQRSLANQRRPIAHTKNRGEVRGGGRKPFRQKGTGRARAGSTRSPIWIGGGVTFGPQNLRNYNQRMPQKMVQKAIFMALSQKVKENKLVIVDSFPFSKVKTKEIQAFLEKLPLEEGKILMILAKTNAFLELSAANLKYLTIIQSQNVNLMDILKNDYLITDKEGIEKLAGIFRGKK